MIIGLAAKSQKYIHGESTCCVSGGKGPGNDWPPGWQPKGPTPVPPYPGAQKHCTDPKIMFKDNFSIHSMTFSLWFYTSVLILLFFLYLTYPSLNQCIISLKLNSYLRRRHKLPEDDTLHY